MKCHKKFQIETDYNSHIEHCIHEKQNIKMPTDKNNIRKYYSFHAEQYHPYTLTLDFECTLKKMKKQITKTTKYIHKHVPNSFCFYSDEMRAQLVRHSSIETLMKYFNKMLQDHGKKYHTLRMKNEKMIGGKEEANKFR